MITQQTKQMEQSMQTNRKQDNPQMADIFKTGAFMTLLRNDRHNRVELHLRGEFCDPQSCTQEISELYQLSEQYPTLLIFINSPGGRVDLLMELYNVTKKFDKVITVCNSQASSAGFMLWSTGDIRVVDECAEMMFHREAWGYGGKTDQILERAEFSKKHFERIMGVMCSETVTEDELERARTTEVWHSGQAMIDRGVAISWEQFHERDTDPMQLLTVAAVNGKYFLVEGSDAAVEVDLSIKSEEKVSISEEIYFGDPTDETSGVMAAMGNVSREDLENSLNVILETEEGRSTLREELRDVYGKGNFQIRSTGEVKVKVEGKWIDYVDDLIRRMELEEGE